MKNDVAIPGYVIDDRLVELRRELNRAEDIRSELRMLESLLLRVQALTAAKSKRFGPRNAIRMTLQDNPRKQADLINMLENTVESKSSNVRRTLYTTIGRLRSEGCIVERDGKLELVEA